MSNSGTSTKDYLTIFNANGTVTVRRVNTLTNLDVTPVNTADDTDDWALIANESAYETRTIPASCGLIFVEDNVWVEGTIPSKVTLVAANVVNSGVAPSAYLLNNIQYGATDGSDGFTLMAERNVLISPSAPNSMNLNGIFIAQDGAFGMNRYESCTYADKTGTLTILGTTVSSKRTGTQWTGTTCNGYARGFQNRVDSYDRNNDGTRKGGMRDWLVNSQDKQIGANQGSWAPEGGSIGTHCGRIGTTSMALLTLDVYYRHLPLYKRNNAGDGALKIVEGAK